MASDFGDDSGEKLIDNFTRYAERLGERAMLERAYQVKQAFEHAKGAAADEANLEEYERRPGEWAKLDMHEFQQIDGYDEIKGAIDAKIEAKGVDAAWFADEKSGKEYLLFKIADAQKVWSAFDELSRETDEAKKVAAERAKGRVAGSRDERAKGRVAGSRDERPLEQRASDAREASEALEQSRAQHRARSRKPRMQENRSR